MWSASVHQFMVDGDAMFAQIPQAPELASELRAVFAFLLGLYHIASLVVEPVHKQLSYAWLIIIHKHLSHFNLLPSHRNPFPLYKPPSV